MNLDAGQIKIPQHEKISTFSLKIFSFIEVPVSLEPEPDFDTDPDQNETKTDPHAASSLMVREN